MVDRLIEEYVNRMTENDIVSFASKNGVELKAEEITMVYRRIKQDWRTIIYGNPRGILDELKEKFDPLTYAKIEQLYIQFKDKYQSYL